MERPMDRRWDPILAHGGAGSIYDPQSIRDRALWGWDFHTVRGGNNPGNTVFVPGLSEL